MTEPLPPGWAWSTVGEMSNVILGQSPPGSSYNEVGHGFPFFQGKAEFRDLYPEVRKWTTQPKKNATAGSILVSVRAPVGPTNIAPFDCSIGRGLAALHPIGGMETSYLLWAMRHTEAQLAQQGTGSTFDAITGTQLKSHPLPTAPLAEQKRIITAIEEHFSRIDATESTAQTALARLDTLHRAILTAAFSGHLVDQDPDDEPASILLERIAAEHPQRQPRHAAQDANQGPSSVSKQLPPGWKWATVNEVSHVVLGQSPPGSTYNKVGYGSPFFQGKAEFGSFYPEVSKWTTEPKKQASAGSILVSVRAPVGPTNIAPFDCAIGRGLVALHPLGRISTEYLLWAMRHTDTMLAQQGTGSTFNAVTGAQLKAHYLPISPLAEQARIVATIEEHFSRIDAAKASLERCLQRCKVLRRAVLAAAFSGRLVEQDSSDEPASVLLERIAAGQPKRCTRSKPA